MLPPGMWPAKSRSESFATLASPVHASVDPTVREFTQPAFCPGRE